MVGASYGKARELRAILSWVGKSKGVIFTTTRLFTERRFGKEAFDACTARLDPCDQAIVSEIVPLGWYPLAPMVRFMRCVDELYGRGDLALCEEMGRFAADWQLGRVKKLLLRFAPGEWVLRRGLNLWHSYHDSGSWSLETPEPNVIIGRLVEFAIEDAAWCRRTQGFLERVGLFTGAREAKVEHPRCVALGDSCCEFTSHWR